MLLKVSLALPSNLKTLFPNGGNITVSAGSDKVALNGEAEFLDHARELFSNVSNFCIPTLKLTEV